MMDLDRDTLIPEVMALQRTVTHAVHVASGPTMLLLDLTMAQLKALIVLADEGPASIGQVAAHLEISLPTASHLVDRLEKAGLARREEDLADRRRTLARPTPRGEDVVNRLRQGSRDQLRAWLNDLADEDLAALARGLRALAHVVQRVDDAPAVPAKTPTSRATESSLK